MMNKGNLLLHRVASRRLLLSNLSTNIALLAGNIRCVVVDTDC